MTKTSEIANLIANGQSNQEIIEAGYTKTLVYRVRKSAPKVETDDVMTEEEQKDFDETPNAGFITKVELTKDETLNTEKKEKKIVKYEFGCGSCGYEWETDSKDQITECPSCGVDLS